MAGGLWAHFITSFSPNAFYLKETFVILGMLVIGGAASVSGALFGALAVTIVYEGLRSLENAINMSQVFSSQVVGLTEIVLACAMIGILILRPAGIVGMREIGDWLVLKRRSRRMDHQ
jgi:branched-chain amino acid transport system permease protein